MAYQFRPDQYYRMPTHFGPSLGPRQGLKGRRYPCTDTPKCTAISATFNANKKQLETLLPPGFILREPFVATLFFEYITDIEWLAGRGYNTFGLSVPATYQGMQDTVHGNLLLVLWENKADPIITGREELGFAKLYSEIPEPQFIDNKVICRANWDGFEFARLELSNLKPVSPKELPIFEPSDGTLHYKYIPKTGSPGEADVEYATLTPAGEPNLKLVQASLTTIASARFYKATWEQLPTLVHIVNTLSTLTLGECCSATVLKAQGGKDLSDQRILR